MRAVLSCVLTATLFSSLQSPNPPVTQSQETATSSPKPALAFGLEDGTPIKLRITRTVSSEDAKVGDIIDFEVLEEVKSHDVLIVPRGGIAWATVTEAEAKRRMGRAGKLNINIDNLKLSDGEKVPLRAVKEVKGGSHVGAMTGAIVATSIVFFPAAPLFSFDERERYYDPQGDGDHRIHKRRHCARSQEIPAGGARGRKCHAGGRSLNYRIEIKSRRSGDNR